MKNKLAELVIKASCNETLMQVLCTAIGSGFLWCLCGVARNCGEISGYTDALEDCKKTGQRP